MRLELARFDLFLASAQRSLPRLELEYRTVVVADVAQEPPQPLRAAHVSVGDDEDAGADARTRGCAHELIGGRKRMSAFRPRRPREILVHVEKRRAGNVAGEV